MLVWLGIFLTIILKSAKSEQGFTIISSSRSWWYMNTLFRIERQRRSTESYISCIQSPIQSNVTLKGGLKSGYFFKLGEHVAIELCIELCCKEKGCDVALMSGKKCYGVQCYDEDLCRSSPAKGKTDEQIVVSHVTFKGEKAVLKQGEEESFRCDAKDMEIGTTLLGGLDAGKFTDIGIVEDSKVCKDFCCLSETCNIAMLINDHCFLVACYSTLSCQLTKSLTPLYMSSVANIRTKLVKQSKTKDTKDTKGSFSLLQRKGGESQLLCKNSEIFYNSTLKGGFTAGNYTNVGIVSTMDACTRWCCSNRDCDAAFMLENNCFAVACRNPESCLPVHAKSTSSSAVLKPKITYITSRSEKVNVYDNVSSGFICHAGIVSYDVTLRGGSNAGKFTPHGIVNDMKTCIFKCCQSEGCNLAMMLRESCFTVVCDNEEKCEKKQTPISSNFNPRIAYIFKDSISAVKIKGSRKHRKQQNPESVKHKKKMLLLQQLTALTSPNVTSSFSMLYPSHAWYVSTTNLFLNHLKGSFLSSSQCASDSSKYNGKELHPIMDLYRKMSTNLKENKAMYTSKYLPEADYSVDKSQVELKHKSHMPVKMNVTTSYTFSPSKEKTTSNINKKESFEIELPMIEKLLFEFKSFTINNTEHFAANSENDDKVIMKKDQYTMHNKDKVNNLFSESRNNHYNGIDRNGTISNGKNVNITYGNSSTTSFYDFLLENFHNLEQKDFYVVNNPINETKQRTMERQQLMTLNKTLAAMEQSIADELSGNPTVSAINLTASPVVAKNLSQSNYSLSATVIALSENVSQNRNNTSYPMNINHHISNNHVSTESDIQKTSPVLKSFQRYHNLLHKNNSNVKQCEHHHHHHHHHHPRLKENTNYSSDHKYIESSNLERSKPYEKSQSNITRYKNSATDYISDALQHFHHRHLYTKIVVDGESSCFRSRIFINVTLRGGYDSGKFKDRGEMKSVFDCARLCCKLTNCNVVMMLVKNCFSVHCKDDYLCESIPARSPVFNPKVCYITHT